MTTQAELLLPEELLLLALRDQGGGWEKGEDAARAAVGAGMLAELTMRGGLVLHDDPPRVTRGKGEATGHPVLDDILDEVADEGEIPAAEAVARFGTSTNLQRLAQGLARQDILKETEERVLLVFTENKYPTADPEPEQRLVERIREAIEAAPDAPLDERTAVLVAIANGTNLLSGHFSAAELDKAAPRLAAIAERSHTDDAAANLLRQASAWDMFKWDL
ncbi:MAG: GPP34 family phosphoprotein [Polyangiaceae bacterium]